MRWDVVMSINIPQLAYFSSQHWYFTSHLFLLTWGPSVSCEWEPPSSPPLALLVFVSEQWCFCLPSYSPFTLCGCSSSTGGNRASVPRVCVPAAPLNSQVSSFEKLNGNREFASPWTANLSLPSCLICGHVSVCDLRVGLA